MDFRLKDFFREATIRICGTLDIEKALQRCLLFIKEYIPATHMLLSVYDNNTNMAEIVAHATGQASNVVSIKVPYTPKVKEEMGKRQNRSIEIWHMKRIGDYEGTRELAMKMGTVNDSGLLMDLVLENTFIGLLTIIHKKKTTYTKNHFRLLRLLNEPFAIALTNYLRYRENQRLQEMLTDDNQYFQDELFRVSGNNLIGADYGLRGVMEMVRRVSHQDSPVLLLGETGVGKEVIANAIHQMSGRSSKPLIRVNCGAIPETLMDSELFGHEKGAFTGASFQKRGRFERAQGGTIFLDEIGELNPNAQVRLLRVLQDKEIERVGGTETIPVDIRVIAATHRNLSKMLLEGSFREDLYFRLKVFPITIPPLRDRVIDIPALVSHFIQKKSIEMKLGSIPALAPGQIDQLMAYPWPGNVRELENAVERALILYDGKHLVFEGIESGNISKTQPMIVSHSEDGQSYNLDDAASLHIQKALSAAKGKVNGPGGAAELLGINPMTLRHRMKKLGISFGRKSKSAM